MIGYDLITFGEAHTVVRTAGGKLASGGFGGFPRLVPQPTEVAVRSRRDEEKKKPRTRQVVKSKVSRRLSSQGAVNHGGNTAWSNRSPIDA